MITKELAEQWRQEFDASTEENYPLFIAQRAAAHGAAQREKELLAVGVVTEDMKMAIRWAPSSAHWSTELVRIFGPNARDGINALDRNHRERLATVRLAAARLQGAAVNQGLLEAAKSVLSNKRGEDDWLVLSVHCRELEAAIEAAEKEMK